MKVLSVIAAALLLSACGPFGGSAAGDPVACEAKMREQLAASMAQAGAGATPTAAAKPAECNGLSDKQLEDIGTKILAGVIPSATP